MLRHGRATFKGMQYIACGPTIGPQLAPCMPERMMVAVQACMCVDEFATESEYEEGELLFGSVQIH